MERIERASTVRIIIVDKEEDVKATTPQRSDDSERFHINILNTNTYYKIYNTSGPGRGFARQNFRNAYRYI